ncbi:MAG: SDR family oxidoreductase [Ferruginibacter sp.]
MILITGATGGLGNATIDSLLQKGVPANNIIALVRDETKATNMKQKGIQIRVGNYNDYHSLKDALSGVDKLLLISSNEMVDRLVQHKNVIDAAIENNVAHIIYTGIDIRSFEDTAIPHVSHIHRDTAAYLDTTVIPYTLLHDNLYADSIPLFLGDSVLETGIFFPAGDGKTPFVPRTDVGEAAAMVLTTTGHEGKAYAIAAETAYSFENIAEMLSEISGKKVKYLRPDLDTYIRTLVDNGVPKDSAMFLGSFGTAIANGEIDTNHSDLEKLLGRKSTPLKAYLAGIYGN